jgi:hypothetical protein
MKRISMLLVVLFSLLCLHARAESSNYVFRGEEIYESCMHAINGLERGGEYDDHRFGVCAGYVAGIIDFHTVATTVESLPVDMFCLPPKISTAEVIRQVTQYLENNPDRQHDLAAYLVILALREVYPCNEENPGR